MMESASTSSRSSTNSSTGCSSSYADLEGASNFNLLLQQYNKSSSSLLFPKRRAVVTLAVISLIISIVCLLCLGGFFCWVFLYKDGETVFPQAARMTGAEGPTEVCVPCLEVSPNPLEMDQPSELWSDLEVRFDEEKGVKMCCAANAAQYAALFKLILQRQQEIKKVAESLENGEGNNTETESNTGSQKTNNATRSVSAHLVFKPPSQRVSGAKKGNEHWKSPAESPLSHVTKDVKFHDNLIFIQTPGLYYVYCQIMYNPSSSSTPLSEIVGLKNVASTYVRRYSAFRSSPDFLLKSRHTRHDVDADRHSSYVGGVFRLNKGDYIYVQSSRPDLISHDDVASFFGLFKVGQ